MIEEVAFLVTGQVNGPRQSITLLVCEECGYTVKEASEDDNISEGNRTEKGSGE
tara:strand:+ start:22347 stop:22508 length:162 start_codon:yes stop_codon:yes gene_type:complete